MEMTTSTPADMIFAAAAIEVMGIPTAETGRILAGATVADLQAAKTAGAALNARPGSAAAIHGPEALEFIDRIITARARIFTAEDPR